MVDLSIQCHLHSLHRCDQRFVSWVIEDCVKVMVLTITCHVQSMSQSRSRSGPCMGPNITKAVSCDIVAISYFSCCGKILVRINLRKQRLILAYSSICIMIVW